MDGWCWCWCCNKSTEECATALGTESSTCPVIVENQDSGLQSQNAQFQQELAKTLAQETRSSEQSSQLLTEHEQLLTEHEQLLTEHEHVIDQLANIVKKELESLQTKLQNTSAALQTKLQKTSLAQRKLFAFCHKRNARSAVISYNYLCWWKNKFAILKQQPENSVTIEAAATDDGEPAEATPPGPNETVEVLWRACYCEEEESNG